jgi:hypothetical protein
MAFKMYNLSHETLYINVSLGTHCDLNVAHLALPRTVQSFRQMAMYQQTNCED